MGAAKSITLVWRSILIIAITILGGLELYRRGKHRGMMAYSSYAKSEISGGKRNVLQSLPDVSETAALVTTLQTDDDDDEDLEEEEDEGSSLEHWMKEREKIYHHRNNRIRKVCEKFGIASSANNEFNHPLNNITDFFLSRSSELMGCFINKVASSSLVSSFLSLDGMNVKKITSPHAYISRLIPKSLEEFNFSRRHFYKFMFVRDPLDRLISCYMDKMVTNPHNSLKSFRKIVLNHAKRRRRKEEAEDNNNNKNTLNNGTTPSFSHFLNYILDTDLLGKGFESHWVPYFRECSPCYFQYDMIGKLETGTDDFTYLWKRTNIDTKLPIPWYNKMKYDAENKLKKLKGNKPLYAQVSRKLLIRFYHRFKMDYDLFGYDFDKVLDKAGYPPMTDEEKTRAFAKATNETFKNKESFFIKNTSKQN